MTLEKLSLQRFNFIRCQNRGLCISVFTVHVKVKLIELYVQTWNFCIFRDKTTWPAVRQFVEGHKVHMSGHHDHKWGGNVFDIS